MPKWKAALLLVAVTLLAYFLSSQPACPAGVEEEAASVASLLQQGGKLVTNAPECFSSIPGERLVILPAKLQNLVKTAIGNNASLLFVLPSGFSASSPRISKLRDFPSGSMLYKIDARRPFMVRLDDLWASPGAESEGYVFEKLNRTMQVIEQAGVKGFVGVTPHIRSCGGHCELSLSTDATMIEVIKALSGMGFAVALHGHNHSCTANTCEFDGLSPNAAASILSMDKDYLERLLGAEVVWFFPPKNAWDQNISQAMAIAGLREPEGIFYDPMDWNANPPAWRGYSLFDEKYDGITIHYNVMDDAKIAETARFIETVSKERLFESPIDAFQR
ncbi:DUF2334 domain-containing protein [Candidatus Micrarchaeota archaeon]|nr:DUF2334 domain-containing protein [Candidatus Micrarchaeota archaeon]